MTNPELRRNLWLEITTHRLLAMPVVLGLAFLVTAALDKPNAVEHAGWLGLGGFVLLTVLWGSRLAANSIIDEMVDKTWDWQRLSILSPWTMTWGKMFGSTAFAWYGGLICLAVFLATASATAIATPFRLTLSLALLAIMLHAVTIAASLHTSRSGAPINRRSIGILLVLVLIYIVPFVLAKAWGSRESVNWFGIDFDGGNFLLVSSALFATWAVVGAFRAMCQSLAVRTTPWLWVLFLAFISIYGAGFVAYAGQKLSHGPTQALALAGLLCGLLFTYVLLFTEQTGPVVLRRVAQKIRGQQWRRALQELPCWPVSLLFAALCALALSGYSASNTDSGLFGGALSPLPSVLLAARDAGIFLFFAATTKPKRVAGTTLVYMLVMDWILPGLLYALGMNQLAEFVFPVGQGDALTQLVSALVQASVVGWLAYRRVQVNLSSYKRADGA